MGKSGVKKNSKNVTLEKSTKDKLFFLGWEKVGSKRIGKTSEGQKVQSRGWKYKVWTRDRGQT